MICLWLLVLFSFLFALTVILNVRFKRPILLVPWRSLEATRPLFPKVRLNLHFEKTPVIRGNSFSLFSEGRTVILLKGNNVITTTFFGKEARFSSRPSALFIEIKTNNSVSFAFSAKNPALCKLTSLLMRHILGMTSSHHISNLIQEQVVAEASGLAKEFIQLGQR